MTDAAETTRTHELVLDSMMDGVVLWSPDFRVRVLNRQLNRFYDLPPGLARPGACGRAILRFMAGRGDYGPLGAEPLDGFVERKVQDILHPAPGQVDVRTTPGGYCVEIARALMPDGSVLNTYRDITRLKAREAELGRARDDAEAARDAAQSADQAKSTFLAAMSHEIRTPMNGVLGMMEVLERSPLAPDQARCLAVMRSSAGSLLRIIDDILDFSKIDAGRMELEELPFSLASLIEGAVDALAAEAARKHLRLFADPPGDGPDQVCGDPVRVRQILFNLIGNAIKFTDRGYVRVMSETRVDGGAVLVTLTVEDSGIGLSDEQIARLFQPFVQGDSTTTRRFGGSGLGLTIIRRLAQMMGGDAAVESMPRRGSRFTVTLRLGPVRPETAGQAPVPAAPVKTGTYLPRLLVADDHAVNREVIERQLELLGLEADMAADGAEAMVLWRKARHFMVLLDLHMPVLDGFGLARAIRQEEWEGGLARTVLVAVTANAMQDEQERSYAAGIDAFVTKPVSLEVLARTLAAWVPMEPAPAAAVPEPPARLLFDPDVLEGLFGTDRARLARLVLAFADSVGEDAATLADAARREDMPAIVGAAHRLKGAARMAGARALADLAGRAEAAALAGGRAVAAAALAGLGELVAATLDAARRSLAER